MTNANATIHNWDLINATYGKYYFEQEKLCVQIFIDTIRITELKNAQKRGKTCKQIVLHANYYNWNQSIKVEILNALQSLTFGEFIEILQEDVNHIHALLQEDSKIRASVEEIKGMDVFSPYIKLKPIKEPKKWTAGHVIKAILSGQITVGECTGSYTDDYAYDNAINFGRGEINVKELARELIEDRYRWSAYLGESEKENQIIIKVASYSKCYKLVFNK